VKFLKDKNVLLVFSKWLSGIDYFELSKIDFGSRWDVEERKMISLWIAKVKGMLPSGPG
jgi:hypothetical protein